MPWSKIKNIILAILAVTNLALLVLVGGQTIQDRRLLSQAREDAIQFLRGRGVEVDESIIPQSMDLKPQIVERDLAGEERAAAALLGSPVTAESRGGEVYRYYNGSGSVQFHNDGTFSAQLKEGAFPLGADRGADCLALMEKMGLQGTILSERGEELTFRQSWKGTPLFTQQVTLVCQGGQLTAMTSGRQLVGRPQEDPARSSITVATAGTYEINYNTTLTAALATTVTFAVRVNGTDVPSATISRALSVGTSSLFNGSTVVTLTAGSVVDMALSALLAVGITLGSGLNALLSIKKLD